MDPFARHPSSTRGDQKENGVGKDCPSIHRDISSLYISMHLLINIDLFEYNACLLACASDDRQSLTEIGASTDARRSINRRKLADARRSPKTAIVK
jgi:hypothetical protein